MSAVFTQPDPAGRALALLGQRRPSDLLAFTGERSIDSAAFLADVRAVASQLPDGLHAVNLCEDRYHFLVSFCAVALRGQVNLLPHSRAPDVVGEALARYPGSYSLVDASHDPMPPRAHRLVLPQAAPAAPAAPAATMSMPELPGGHCMAIGFTSGSSGQPKPNAKSWASLCASNARNTALLDDLLEQAGHARGGASSIVATVPPQHMYGLETSVVLPLLGRFAVHAGRPFFPADVARALAEAPAPRLLVTTPVHLRALLGSGIAFPDIAGIVSATAPLPAELAIEAERHLGAPVQEMFGSTETCVIAHRRTAHTQDWHLYEGVELLPQPDGSLVSAAWLAEPVTLQDIVELLPGRCFRLRGRNSDLLEIAGKRASLSELTRRLLALDGVEDAVVFQPAGDGVRRVAALVVAPTRSEADLLEALRCSVDPVFLPRPLKKLARLPRNETGKLPRAALLRALSGD